MEMGVKETISVATVGGKFTKEMRRKFAEAVTQLNVFRVVGQKQPAKIDSFCG